MFKGKLYSEQISGAEFLANKKKSLLAWEQGTGKTVISIATSDKLAELDKAAKVLVLCPTSFSWQWVDEIEEFTTMRPVWVTAKNKESRAYEVKDNEIWVVGWHLFRNDYKKIKDVEWDIVVADEAQEFASPRSKTRKLMLALNRQVDPTYRWALTGTAINRKLEDLHSIMYWVDKEFLPPWPKFEEQHIVRNDFGTITDYKNLKALHKHLPHRVSVKTHKDMEGKLPKILPKVVRLPKSKEYKEIETRFLELAEDYVDQIKVDGQGNLITPRRSKELGDVWQDLRRGLAGPKLDFAAKEARDVLGENPNNRYVLFSFYKDPLYEMESIFQEMEVPCWKFTGDESQEEKRANVHSFRDDGGVLLASDAGHKGLNLPFANYLAHLDVPFSFGRLDQRNKRITRRSSTFGSVVVTYILIEDSMEEYYMQLVKNQEDLHNAVFHGSADEVAAKEYSLRQFLRGK